MAGETILIIDDEAAQREAVGGYLRKSDIPLLADHFLARYAEENGKAIGEVSKEALELLTRYAYPGNVRELQNIVERAVVMTRGEVVTRADLPVEVQPGCLRNTHGRLRRRKRR